MATDTPNIMQRINQVCRAVPRVAKDRENKHQRYTYIGHDDVTAALRPAMVQAGIVQCVSIVEVVPLEEGRVRVYVDIAWVNTDNPEDKLSVRAVCETAKGKSGPQPQSLGAAVSYACKTAQLKNFLLVGDDTPDMEQYDTGDRSSYEPRKPKEPPVEQSDYENYCKMLRDLGSQSELDAVGGAISAIRDGFDVDQMAKLEELYQDAEKRVQS